MRFHCPLDGKALSAFQSSLRCPDGHSFDLAREGYCNLLLAHQKSSLDPGDNKEMVDARRRFLSHEYFAPIAERQLDILREIATPPANVLDAGCGEGYYLNKLHLAFPQALLSGVDISKWAVKAAAKSNRGVAWAVASNKQLPFAKHSLDVILSTFGFPFWASFHSMLVPGGHLLLIDPGPEHLLELRALIYEKVKCNDLCSIEDALASGFTLERQETLDFEIELQGNTAIQDLLSMTPHGYRMGAKGRERLKTLNSLKTKCSVVFRLLAKAKR